MNNLFFLNYDDDIIKRIVGSSPVETMSRKQRIEKVLNAAGTTKELVTMCRVYIPDMDLWDEVNSIYAEFFGDHKPARVVVPTRDLHHGVLVEIEATAEMPESI